jgi:hypothetical protein
VTRIFALIALVLAVAGFLLPPIVEPCLEASGVAVMFALLSYILRFDSGEYEED